MKISEMTAGTMFMPPEWDREFNHIHSDSRDIRPGDLFVARKGHASHGQEYISAAIDAGAVAVFSENAEMFRCESGNVPVFPVTDLEQQLPVWLQKRYPGFSSLTLYGVTGTNGKSSVTQFIAQLAAASGKRCGVVGTLGNGFFPDFEETKNTTPDICVVYRLLDQFFEAGAGCAALEVSSHGLHQGRVAGLVFDVAVLTNITQDHLDYHGDMANYFAAKAALFDKEKTKSAVINIDDEYGSRLLNMPDLCGHYLTLSSLKNNRADVLFDKIVATENGMKAELHTPWGTDDVYLPLLGEFNVANLAAAVTALAVTGEDFNKLLVKAETLQPVAGRMALYTKPGACKAVVDFAHTPDAIAVAINSLTPLSKSISLVFGCGGDRDRTKRPLMASAAALADKVWLTDDNPRTESAEQIFNDVSDSPDASDFTYIHDRASAITAAIEATPEDGVLMIAGKGHENYQDIMGVKQKYSDEAVLLSLGYQRAGGGYAS
jgi:UDP-N-acetylmuramoyl-L-alanyl-D-glutamate--2,6-diaminopimelate ligase